MPLLPITFQKTQGDGILPNETSITLIPNPDKWITKREYVRPMSLVNIDTEILNKMLADQIKQCVKRSTRTKWDCLLQGCMADSEFKNLSLQFSKMQWRKITWSRQVFRRIGIEGTFFTSIENIYKIPCSWYHAYHGRTACVPLWWGIRPGGLLTSPLWSSGLALVACALRLGKEVNDMQITEWEKTIPLCTWQDSLHRESQGIYQKTPRASESSARPQAEDQHKKACVLRIIKCWWKKSKETQVRGERHTMLMDYKALHSGELSSPNWWTVSSKIPAKVFLLLLIWQDYFQIYMEEQRN